MVRKPLERMLGTRFRISSVAAIAQSASPRIDSSTSPNKVSASWRTARKTLSSAFIKAVASRPDAFFESFLEVDKPFMYAVECNFVHGETAFLY